MNITMDLSFPILFSGFWSYCHHLFWCSNCPWWPVGALSSHDLLFPFNRYLPFFFFFFFFFLVFPRFFGIDRYCWLTLYFLCLSLESSISPRRLYPFLWRSVFRSQHSAPDMLIIIEVCFSHILSVNRVGNKYICIIFTCIIMYK